MKVKRIFAPDMRQAMRRVREEIGPDAVIVSSHRVAGGVEVVAAHEQEYEAAQAEFKHQSQERRRRDEQVQALTGADPSRTGRQGLEDEMRKVRARIASAQPQVQVPSPAPVQPVQPVPQPAPVQPAAVPPLAASPAHAQGRLSRRLDGLGIGPRVVRHLVSSVEQDLDIDKAWRSSLARLSDAIAVVGEEFIERGGMVAFVGPTGVGKTTTIGKLAARYVLKHGSASLALVTTDSYRIAAHEQLRTLGRILDVPVRVVDEKHSLDEVLHSLKGKRLVLIDTAGMSADEPHTAAQIELLQGVSLRLKKLLVLSCSSQRRVIESAYTTCQKLGLSGCVLSKLDESGSLGEALTLTIEKQLPIAYVTDGQKIPDDIGVARRHDLVSRAVVTAQKAQEREQQSDEGLDLSFIGRAG